MVKTSIQEQERNRFIQVLKEIKSAKSIALKKQYSNISVTDTLTHIVGYRESRTKFRINIDTLCNIYYKGNIESLRPSDLKEYFPHSRFRSPACAILHRVYKREQKQAKNKKH